MVLVKPTATLVDSAIRSVSMLVADLPRRFDRESWSRMLGACTVAGSMFFTVAWTFTANDGRHSSDLVIYLQMFFLGVVFYLASDRTEGSRLSGSFFSCLAFFLSFLDPLSSILAVLLPHSGLSAFSTQVNHGGLTSVFLAALAAAVFVRNNYAEPAHKFGRIVCWALIASTNLVLVMSVTSTGGLLATAPNTAVLLWINVAALTCLYTSGDSLMQFGANESISQVSTKVCVIAFLSVPLLASSIKHQALLLLNRNDATLVGMLSLFVLTAISILVHAFIVRAFEADQIRRMNRLSHDCEELRTVLDNVPSGMHVIDDEGQLITMNVTERLSLGYEQDSLRQLRHDAVITQQSVESLARRIPLLNSVQWVHEVPIEFVRKNRSTYGALASIHRDSETKRITVVSQDLETRNQYESRLTLLSMVIDRLHTMQPNCCVFTCNHEGEITAWSDGSSLLGYKRNDVLNQSVQIFCRKLGNAGLRPHLDKAFQTRKKQEYEGVLEKIDATLLPCKVSIEAVRPKQSKHPFALISIKRLENNSVIPVPTELHSRLRNVLADLTSAANEIEQLSEMFQQRSYDSSLLGSNSQTVSTIAGAPGQDFTVKYHCGNVSDAAAFFATGAKVILEELELLLKDNYPPAA